VTVDSGDLRGTWNDKGEALLSFATSLARSAYLSCFVMTALYLVGALLWLHSGWDDGAITLAYARTYFHTGSFSLTPVSTAVEGTSSLLWTVMMGLASILSQKTG
jgi:hypothetical protein